MYRKPYKIKSAVLFFLLIFPAFAQAQNGFISKFGFGLGYSMYRVIPKFEAINPVTENFGVGKFSSSGLWAGGLGGFLYVPVIENFRIGAYKYNGTEKLNGISQGAIHEADYTASGWAVTMEYSMPWTPGYAVSAGLGFGEGSTTLEMYENDGYAGWPYTASSPNVYRKMYIDYLTVTPTLTIDIPVYKFIILRAGAGYQFAFGGNWKADNGIELRGVPGGVKDNTFYFQTGIYIGFVSF